MGFCEDISSLPNYEPTDSHFLFTDIQLGKGKARPVRQVKMLVDGSEEVMNYRIIPCGGVKLCGRHNEGCTYVAACNKGNTTMCQPSQSKACPHW